MLFGGHGATPRARGVIEVDVGVYDRSGRNGGTRTCQYETWDGAKKLSSLHYSILRRFTQGAGAATLRPY